MDDLDHVRDLTEREQKCIVALIEGSTGRTHEWRANLRHARTTSRENSTALFLTYPGVGRIEPRMQNPLTARLAVGDPEDLRASEVVAWSDGDYIAAVEHLWYGDETPQEWPLLKDVHVVPNEAFSETQPAPPLEPMPSARATIMAVVPHREHIEGHS